MGFIQKCKYSISTVVCYFSVGLLVIVLSACENVNKREINELKSERTKTEERRSFHESLVTKTIEKPLTRALNDSTEEAWQGAFWGISFSHYRSEIVERGLNRGFANIDNRSEAFQRGLLEAAIAAYPNTYKKQIEAYAKSTNNEKLFAMALFYLSRLEESDIAIPGLRKILRQQFPGWNDSPHLIMADYRLKLLEQGKIYEDNHPPLSDLLKANLVPGKPVIFSIQRHNRKYPGRVIIRLASGAFDLTSSREPFSVEQLALSASNMPGTITNGNTPEGIYSLQGFGTSENVFIGPAITITTRLPFEVSTSQYFHNASDYSTWSKKSYRSMLPDSWQNYLPIYEAYYAGRAGRTAIIGHGTTINPNYYINEPYYPFTPSLGCMTTLELWNQKTGKRDVSGQYKLVQRMNMLGIEDGYWVVVNIPGEGAVTNAELIPHIRKAQPAKETP